MRGDYLGDQSDLLEACATPDWTLTRNMEDRSREKTPQNECLLRTSVQQWWDQTERELEGNRKASTHTGGAAGALLSLRSTRNGLFKAN